MKAAVLDQYSTPLVVDDVDIQMPMEGEVLVSILASGVCHSSLTVSRGLSRAVLPLILGYEVAEIIEKSGPSVSRVSVGYHVLLLWAPNCGHCYYCQKTLPVMCDAYGIVGNAGGLWDGTSRLRSRGKTIYHYYSVASFAKFSVVLDAGCIKIDASMLSINHYGLAPPGVPFNGVKNSGYGSEGGLRPSRPTSTPSSFLISISEGNCHDL